jgi:hypothetical protein
MKRYDLTRVFASLVFLNALLACSGAPEWTGSVEMRNGVEVVLNPGRPLFDEAQGFVSELWAVQGSAWADPSRVHAASGLLTVVDPDENQFHVVTTSGETRESVGRPGGGPGEFLRMQDAFRHGDGFVVLDQGRSSIESLDLEGGYVSSLHLEGSPWRGFPMRGGDILLVGDFREDPTEGTLGDWIRVQEDGEITPFIPQPLEPLPEEQGVECSEISPWGGGAARLRFSTPQIQVFDRTGDLVRESWIDLPVEVVSEAERSQALSELRSRLAADGGPPEFLQQYVDVMEERWRVKCRFGPLRADPAGGIVAFLEENPDVFGSGNATLHFLSPEGVYLAKAAFPTPWRDFTLDNGVIYALTRDPTTDLVALRAYRVDLPDRLFTDAAEVLEEARQRAAGDDP